MNTLKHKLLTIGIALLIGISFIASVHVAHADKQINAGQYTTDIQTLQKIFTTKNEGFNLSEITVENDHDFKTKPVYKMEGFNHQQTQEREMKIAATDIHKTLKNKSERIARDERKHLVAINLNDVKKQPDEAIKAAQKYAGTKNNPSEWQLKAKKRNNQVTTYYQVTFVAKHRETTVTVDTTTGDKIKITTEHD